MSSVPRSAIGWFLVSAAAAVAHHALARRVRRGETRELDASARREVLSHASRPARVVAMASGPVGKWYVYVPAAAASAAALGRDGRYSAAATIAGVAVSAAGLGPILDRLHAHRTPPPGKRREEPAAQSFPSGHALETTAVALAAAWIVAREKLAPVGVVAPVAAALALVSGLGRIVLDRHWLTDGAAGYIGGIALGALTAGAYEVARDAN
jgi:membrane-associated phospholipid phosphatase